MERNNVIADNVKEDDNRLFALLSIYLNNKSDFISKEDIDEIVKYDVSINSIPMNIITIRIV
ncbi:hypothetical protein D3C81_2008160 [compost metagenome]